MNFHKILQASVKYLWSLKDAIKRLDWNTLENSTLLKLCLLCTRDFKFIQNPDGRKFIACLFTLDPNLVQVKNLKIQVFYKVNNMVFLFE